MNPHPPLSSFPFVLCATTLLFEALFILTSRPRFAEFGRALLWVLAVVTPLTYFSGYWGSEAANATFQIDPALIASHQLRAKIYLFLLYTTLVLREVGNRAEFGKAIFVGTFRLGLLLTFCAVAWTSYLGGELVFEHGAGVRAKVAE